VRCRAVHDLQRLLYGLDALLELHFAQEDESFLSLADETPSGTGLAAASHSPLYDRANGPLS
jgi:hypothetical protein